VVRGGDASVSPSKQFHPQRSRLAKTRLLNFIQRFLFVLELRAARTQVRQCLAWGITHVAWLSWPSSVSRSSFAAPPLLLMIFSIVKSQAEHLSSGRDTKRRGVSRSHPKTMRCSTEDPSASSLSSKRMARLKTGSISLACVLLVTCVAGGATHGFLARFSGESGQVSIGSSTETPTFPASSGGTKIAGNGSCTGD